MQLPFEEASIASTTNTARYLLAGVETLFGNHCYFSAEFEPKQIIIPLFKKSFITKMGGGSQKRRADLKSRVNISIALLGKLSCTPRSEATQPKKYAYKNWLNLANFLYWGQKPEQTEA